MHAGNGVEVLDAEVGCWVFRVECLVLGIKNLLVNWRFSPLEKDCYLAQCINYSDLESQTPHKIVDLVFTITT